MNTATETAPNTKPILVLGGTGKTGARVATRLQALGRPVRIGSRKGVPPFDWEDRSTWAPVLRGAEAVYITFQPDLAVPGAVDAVRSFAAQAVASGIGHLVLLSGRGEAEAEEAERAIQASGADWTILRASWFAQNFSESFLIDGVLDGTVVLPVGDVGEPFIDVADIADVAVAALTEPGHRGKLYELTGPRLLSFTQAVAEIAAASGRDIRLERVAPQDYARMLEQAGVPEDYTGLLIYLFTTVLDGRNASLADGVQLVLGRPPRDFGDYARETAAAGIWTPEVRTAAGAAE